MKKYTWILVLCLCCALLFAGCGGCKHEWAAATCTTPKTCELCGITEGEAKGHTWEDATCDLPKKCATCHLTEGEALGHTWEEATTEAPKTCLTCQATEGSKLDVDSRFTTASTKELYGHWTSDAVLTGDMMGLPGYFDSMPITMHYEFTNLGEVTLSMELRDEEAFMVEFKRMTMDLMYESLAQQGISKEDGDKAMQQAYGMTMEEYVSAYVENVDMEELFAQFSSESVYYVEDNKLYTGDSWSSEFSGSEYTLENGVLIIEDNTLEDGGEPLQWTKDEESK